MKRQANALTAVLENWQDVENAIDIYANSAGSALRENEIYLDSWEAKSKAVSAAWNELVNSLINSDWIKGFLDIAQGVLSWLTETNALVPILIGFIAGGLTSAIKGLIVWIQTLIAEGGALNVVFGGFPIIIGLITTLAVGVVTWGINASDTAKQIENLTNKIEEQQKAIDDLNAKEKEATDLYKEYASLMSKSNAYGLSTEEKENLLKISNDLVDTYGLEVEGIDAVTGAYKIGTDAINSYVDALRNERIEKLGQQKEARNDRIDKNIDKIKDAKKKNINEGLEFSEKFWVSGNWAQAERKNEELLELIGINEKRPWYIKASDGFYGDKLEENYDTLLENYEKVMVSDVLNDEEKARLEKWANAYRSEGAKISSEISSTINSIVKDLITNIQVDNADMLDSSGESLLTQLLTPYLTTIDWKNFKQDEFETKVKEFATQAASGLSEVATKLQDSQKKITSGEMNLSGYEDMYSTLQNKAGLLKQMLDQGIIDQKSYEEQVSQIYSQVANNIGLSMVEIAGKISETDKQSQQNFKNVADSFVALENQFRQGKISSVEYLTSITETIENMDFTKTFGENTEAAQQFFSTLANKSANILQDTITQFESGKMSVKDYGDNLKNFAKQQKELAKNAIEEAKALGMSEDAVKELTDEYDKNGKAIDDAVKKWEELDGINAYLDDNIETLRTATNVASEAYQSFATGLYNEFTKLSDNMQSQIIADMQKMEGLGHITAENLKAEMAKSTSASAGLASAVASNTNDVFKNLANNGGKVLTALGNAIKNFKYTITFNPNAKFSGGEFNLIKWAKSGGQEGIKLPSISWDITGKAGGGAEGLGEALSGLGQSLSVASDFLDISDYGGGSGGGGNGNGGGGSGGGGKKGSGSDKNKPDYEDPTDAIINRINLRADELAQQEEEIQNLIEIAELENDYKKQISLTNDLIAIRRKRVDELNKANAGLHNEAEHQRNIHTFYNEDGTESDENLWFDSQGNATEYYYDLINKTGIAKEEREAIEYLFERLSKYKKAYADNAEEIIGLNKEILKGEKDIADTREESYNEALDEVQRYADRVSDYYDKINKGLDKQIQAKEAILQITQKQTDATGNLMDAQTEIDKALRDAKLSTQYLTKEEREKIFNEDDYNKLSSIITTTQNDINTLTADFMQQIEDAYANDQLYLVEAITAEYERQVDMKERELEIAKAQVDLTKKQMQLNNVLAEKNVKQLVERNGQFVWEWVADNEKVRQATEDVLDAEAKIKRTEYDKNHQLILNGQQSVIDGLNSQKGLNDYRVEVLNGYVDDISLAIENSVDPIKDFASISALLDGASSDVLSAFNKITSSILGTNSEIYNTAKGINSTSSKNAGLASVYKSNDYSSAIYSYLAKGDVDSALAANRIRNDKIDYLGLSEDKWSEDKIRNMANQKLAVGSNNTRAGWTALGEKEPEMYIDSSGHLIPINQPTLANIDAGGIVFNQDQMANLRSLWDMSNIGKISMDGIVTDRTSLLSQPASNETIFSGDINVYSPHDYNDFVRALTQRMKQKNV